MYKKLYSKGAGKAIKTKVGGRVVIIDAPMIHSLYNLVNQAWDDADALRKELKRAKKNNVASDTFNYNNTDAPVFLSSSLRTLFSTPEFRASLKNANLPMLTSGMALQSVIMKIFHNYFKVAARKDAGKSTIIHADAPLANFLNSQAGYVKDSAGNVVVNSNPAVTNFRLIEHNSDVTPTSFDTKRLMTLIHANSISVKHLMKIGETQVANNLLNPTNIASMSSEYDTIETAIGKSGARKRYDQAEVQRFISKARGEPVASYVPSQPTSTNIGQLQIASPSTMAPLGSTIPMQSAMPLGSTIPMQPAMTQMQQPMATSAMES